MHLLDVPYFKQDTGYTCGPTSLQMVFAFYGIQESERSLADELATDVETGTSHERMIAAVRARDLHCYVNDRSAYDELCFLHSHEVPIVVRFIEPAHDDDHYGVVIGADDTHVVIHDPWNGPSVKFDRDAFLTRWTCDTIGDCREWLMAVSREPFELGKQFHPHE